MLKLSTVVILTSCALAACGGATSSSTPIQSTPSTPPITSSDSEDFTLTFSDETNARGLAHKSEFSPGLNKDPRYFAGGGAAGDIDNDGDIDIFITRGDTLPNLLFMNDGSGNFTDQAESAGLAFPKGGSANYKLSGPSFADLDGDGDLDLFVGGVDGEPSLIFRNNGDSTFSDVTASSGIPIMNAPNTLSSAFGDYDLDGDLDLALAHWGTPRDRNNPGSTETIWRNDSDSGLISFTDVSQSSGIASQVELGLRGVLGPDHDYTFSPNFVDVNGDR